MIAEFEADNTTENGHSVIPWCNVHAVHVHFLVLILGVISHQITLEN
ncbi:MAG: hypothetical protein ACJAUL_003996 [Paraglaciecola sp.]|jgi:hypothetical protein